MCSAGRANRTWESLGAAVTERGVMAREEHPGVQARERSLLAVGHSKRFTNMLHSHMRLTQCLYQMLQNRNVKVIFQKKERC